MEKKFRGPGFANQEVGMAHSPIRFLQPTDRRLEQKAAESKSGALWRDCPVCNAHAGDPCTQPTNTGRTPVRFFHYKRQERW